VERNVIHGVDREHLTDIVVRVCRTDPWC
jgi:hypothetical protein